MKKHKGNEDKLNGADKMINEKDLKSKIKTISYFLGHVRQDLNRMNETNKKKNNILACNDNHIVHHFTSLCSFFSYKRLLGGWR